MEEIKTDSIDFLNESSYFFPDFKDIIIDDKEIYPLDYISLIDEEKNQGILDALLNEIPFYQITPQKVLFDGDIDKVNKLSESRDSSIINVPSIMQTSPFYQAWFRNAWGYLYNKIILDVFNKLRYPFISEHQYLMIDTISKLVEYTFNGDANREIELNTDCSYLNEIVKERIESTTSLLDINFNNNEFLDNVIESMYYGGILSSDEKESERYVFLLQEIKNELLRRKLAGTFTLYKMATSSLGRTGSFINACKVKDFLRINGRSSSKNTERYYRYVNILGLTTKKIDKDSESLDIMSIYKDIPQKLLSEIYYTSSDSNYFSADTPEKLNNFLRDRVSVIKWNTLENVVSQENLVDTYDYLDMKNLDDPNKEGLTITLDEKGKANASGDQPTRHLDTSRKRLSYESLLKANILDINADQFLYHDYTKTSGIDKYQYLTYPIANGNGISLVDTFWLDYIENSLRGKTKVTDNTMYGVQVSKYVDLSNQFATKSFFGYTIENDTIYLHYCTIRYNNSYVITGIDNKIITKIVKSTSDDYEYYEGVIPFTYKDYVDDRVKESNPSIETYNGYNKAYFVFSENDITKNLLPSGNPFNYGEGRIISYKKPDSIRAIYYVVKRIEKIEDKEETTYSWSEPINVINLKDGDNSWFTENNLLNSKHFSPDWKGLAFYLNPYLNFTKESASPLRHKKVFTTNLTKASLTKDNASNVGASETTFLCNLTRMRELDYWANDNNSDGKPVWSDVLETDNISMLLDDYENKLGLYLENYTDSKSLDSGSYCLKANSNIYGDNRALSIVDVRNIKDSSNKPCRILSLEEKLIENTSSYDLNNIFTNKNDTTLYVLNISNKYVKYYIYNPNSISFTEVIPDDFIKLSKAYLDSQFKDYCISLQEDVITGLGVNNAELKNGITNYLRITSSTKETDKDCYWDSPLYGDQTEWGRTICVNVYIHSDLLLGKKDYVLVEQLLNDSGNFSLVLTKDDNTYKITFKWYPTRTKNYYWFVEKDITNVISQSLRISASIYFVTKSNTTDKDFNQRELISTYLSIAVNGSITSTEFAFSQKNRDSSFYYDNINFNPLETDDIKKFASDISIDKESTYIKNVDYLIPIQKVPIYIGYNSINGITTFMDIFDLRLYNEGKSPEELRLLNMGTMYELYSYSPCAYNLAYNLYNDMGIFKVSNLLDSYDYKGISLIRLFNRSVWDSILIDNFPITDEEKNKGPQKSIVWRDPYNDTDVYLHKENAYVLNDCIEQELLSNVEVYNNINLTTSSVDLEYNGNSINLTNNDSLDVILSTISPSVGNKVDLNNEITFRVNQDTKMVSSSAINLPIETSGNNDDYFSYTADLYPIFNVDNNIYLDSWLTRGNNITVTYDSQNNCNFVTLFNTSILDSEKNSAIYPLYISDGESVSFKISDYKLSNALQQMLKATSYYTEVCIPVPCKRKNKNSFIPVSSTDYEVEKNIPCYYIKNNENQYSKISEGVFQAGITYYTTTNGTAFEEATVYAEDIIPAYYTKQGEQFVQCDGSEKFTSGVEYYLHIIQYTPEYHYKWDGIRLLQSGDYELTCRLPMRIRHFNPSMMDDSSTTTFYGSLTFIISVAIQPKENKNVATEYTHNILVGEKKYFKDNLNNNISYLDPEGSLAEDTLVYKFPHADVKISLMCNNISITPSSSDSKISTVTNLCLKRDYKKINSPNFTIEIGNEENLNGEDKIVLNSNTAYELLVDYDSCIINLSHTDVITKKPSNILENINTTDYGRFMYTKDISDGISVPINKNSGFAIKGDEFIAKSDDNNTFGDYRDTTGSNNALFSLYDRDEDSVRLSYPIYYLDTPTELLTIDSRYNLETEFTSSAILADIYAFTDTYGSYEKVSFTEKEILESIYNELSIGRLLLLIGNSPMGALSGLSKLTIDSGSPLSINLKNYNLYAYKKPAICINNQSKTTGIYNYYTKVNSYSNIYLPSYESIVLEDKTNKGKYIPIQFRSSVVVGNDGYSRPIYGSTQAMLFITNNSYREYEKNSSIKGLINPWKKQLYITQSINSNGQTSNGVYSYTIHSDGKEVVVPFNDTSIYKDIITNSSISNGYTINIVMTYDFTKYESNLVFNNLSLVNESVSYVYNCFNINNYMNKDRSNIVVTNIQFLGESSYNEKTILYELEYLPIIYDEKKHHISINLLLKKN